MYLIRKNFWIKEKIYYIFKESVDDKKHYSVY